VRGSLRDALLEMHRKGTSSASKLRTQKGRQFEKHQLPNLETGDFVFPVAPEKKFHPELRAKWAGPYRVVETISNYVYQVEHLVHGAQETLTFVSFDFTHVQV